MRLEKIRDDVTNEDVLHQPFKESIGILGCSMELPHHADMIGEDLFCLIQENQILRKDLVKEGIIEGWNSAPEGDQNPWLFQHRFANRFHPRTAKGWGDMSLMGISEKESRFMDEPKSMALTAVWRALENCGLPMGLIHKSRTGVFVAGYSSFGVFDTYPDETSIRGSLLSGMADRIAYFLGIHGPSITLETACSSSLVAMTIAANSIQNGSCDVAIVVGVNLSSDEYELALQASGVMSKSGECRPFDEHADGTMRCEGFGCIILCTMSWARENSMDQNIDCILLNATMGSAGADPNAKVGHCSGRQYEAPNARGMAEMIRLCHAQISLPLDKVSYVEAHATGTSVGDLIELTALKDVYKDSHNIETNPLRVGSIKGNIGHAELAAGLFSTIKAIEMIKKRTFLPTGGENICARSDFDWIESNIKLCLESEPFPEDELVNIGVNSFGVGGSYAHVILSEHCSKRVQRNADDRQALENGEILDCNGSLSRPARPYPLIFSISAATSTHLEVLESDLMEYLHRNRSTSLLDICGCYQVNRSKLEISRHYLVTSISELESKLSCESKPPTCEGTGQGTVAMIFTGQGAQWRSMGHGLMIFDTYRKSVSHFDAFYRKLSGWSPLEMLTSLDEEAMSQTMYAQPLTCMLQIGLVNLFKYFGVTPSVVLGHSAGEIAALYCSGTLSLEQAASVVYYRSSCQQILAGSGRMLAVRISKKEAQMLLSEHCQSLQNCEVACVNSSTSVVVGGPEQELRVFREKLPDGIKSTFLKGNTSFHTAAMDTILDEVERKLSFLPQQQILQGVPVVSTVTGRSLRQITREYFAHNIRYPVQFEEGMTFLLQVFEPSIVLEIGPHKTLAPLVLESEANQGKFEVMTSLNMHTDDVQSIWNVLYGLLHNDVQPNFCKLYRDLGYTFSVGKRFPRHPFLKPVKTSIFAEKRRNTKFKYDVGPTAGTMVTKENMYVSTVEISRVTCADMMDHVMGDQAILPGMYFIEAAIENIMFESENCAVVMGDVSFIQMCTIPDRSKVNATRFLYVRRSCEKKSGMYDFSVESKSSNDPSSRDPLAHCSGLITTFELPGVLDGNNYILGAKGYQEKNPLVKDIGSKGIQDIFCNHPIRYDAEQVYSMINIDDVVNYGKSFRVIQEVWTNLHRDSIVGRLRYDNAAWKGRGGAYGIQLLDGILQLSFLSHLNEMDTVMYAGGFEYALFARRPLDQDCFVKFQVPQEIEMDGQAIVSGNAWMYDREGRLLVYLEGVKYIRGKTISKTIDCFKLWHPVSSTTPNLGSSTVSSISGAILELLQLKKSTARIGCSTSYLRLLEIWEDEEFSPFMYSSLSQLEYLPADSLIEIFIATFTPAAARKTFHVPLRHKDRLRIRVISLPSAHDALNEFCFDGIAVWNKEKCNRETSGSEPKTIPEFEKYGAQDFLLLHSDRFMYPDSWDDFVFNKNNLEGGIISCWVCRDSLVQDRKHKTEVLVLCLGNDAWLAEDFSSTLSSFALKNRSGVNIEVKSWNSNAAEQSDLILELISQNQDNEKHVVVLNGLIDESKYAQDTFVGLARFAGILGAELQRNLRCKLTLWVMVSNISCPPVNQDHCSLLPLVSGMRSAYPCLSAKLVDVEDPSFSLEPLASLIMHNYGAWQYLLANGNDLFQAIMLPSDARGERIAKSGQMISASDESHLYRCELTMEKQKEGYDFFVHPIEHPGMGKVLVQVHAASLNFRDTMLTLGALPRSSFDGSYYGRTLGMECAGVVIEVGEGVQRLKKGDHVVLTAPGCFSSKVTVEEGHAIPFDRSKITLDEAATLSSVYCTAYHALIDLSNVQKGERVLVHAAAGGVGHAAISICRYIGAEVYATTSDGKREYCVTQLGIPESNIFDSRSVAWFNDLMHATEDNGVDIVLNCLAGEHQRLGLQALRPGGRFCEIGKVDIFNNEPMFLYLFRKNIRFFAIDLDRMQLDQPNESHRIMSKVFAHVLNGDFSPLPFKKYKMNDIKQAIDHMKTGTHIGKLLLTNFDNEGRPVSITTNPSLRFSPDQCVLILGGAGGFGSRICSWAFRKGARKFITTVSRDPGRVEHILAEIIEDGATVDVIVADLSKEEEYAKIEEHVMQMTSGQVGTIIHCAGIYEPFDFEDIQEDSLERMMRIKVGSALLLHDLSLKMIQTVQNFILVGSSSAEIGSVYFTGYGGSNCILDGISRFRESLGLPSTVLNMTSIKDVGMASRDQATIHLQTTHFGIEMIPSSRALSTIEKMLSTGVRSMYQVSHMPYDRARSKRLGWNGAYTTALVQGQLVHTGASDESKNTENISYEDVLEFLTQILREIFDIEDVSHNSSMQMIGLDSLNLIELRSHLLLNYGYSLDRMIFAMTVGDLAKDIVKKKENQMDSDEPTSTHTGTGEVNLELQEDVPRESEVNTFLKCFHTPKNDPRGHLILIPGADLSGIYFSDWKSDDIQLVTVQIPQSMGKDPRAIAKVLATSLHEKGYLRKKVVVMGFSFGCFVGLELCREIKRFSCKPLGFIPAHYAPPHVCGSNNVIPNSIVERKLFYEAYQRIIMQEYGEYDLMDTLKSQLYLQDAGVDEFFVWMESLQLYFKQVSLELKETRDPYIGGNIPVHCMFGKKDFLGNPNRVSDDEIVAGWATYTEGPVKAYPWYSTHSIVLNDSLEPVFRKCVIEIAESLMQ